MPNEHYDAGGIEVIEIIKAKLTPEQFTGFLLGNCMKYSLRCNFKGVFEGDISKLEDYSSWLKEHTEYLELQFDATVEEVVMQAKKEDEEVYAKEAFFSAESQPNVVF